MKEGERARGAEENRGTIIVTNISATVPTQQMEKFGESTKNTASLQLLARNISLTCYDDVVVSGIIVDKEVLSDQHLVRPDSAIDLLAMFHGRHG